eukprot:TRINITY_DN1693_c0_g1_i1.p1 TRINITY_DN1693_c0_g1~~TRINITY_DN1693_c0_g1_i1.p1  ORF type:complete len:186 (+),score=33.47 TRINITY_DN1693_c0_g1_i1:84-560(+)
MCIRDSINAEYMGIVIFRKIRPNKMESKKNSIIESAGKLGLAGLIVGGLGYLAYSLFDESRQSQERSNANPIPVAQSTGTTHQTETDDRNLGRDPITFEIMKDPYVTRCGHSFQRQTIENCITRHGKCPICRTDLTLSEISPNYALKEIIPALYPNHR